MPNLTKRENLEVLLVIALTLVAFAVLYFVLPHKQYKVYDCGMAEWHPDIPVAVKEECRKLRAKNFQESLQKPK